MIRDFGRAWSHICLLWTPCASTVRRLVYLGWHVCRMSAPCCCLLRFVCVVSSPSSVSFSMRFSHKWGAPPPWHRTLTGPPTPASPAGRRLQRWFLQHDGYALLCRVLATAGGPTCPRLRKALEFLELMSSAWRPAPACGTCACMPGLVGACVCLGTPKSILE